MPSKDMEKISIIVPYYNSNVFLLRKCLSSILRQTYTNLEILVVEDGSEKDLDYLKTSYVDSDNRIRFEKIQHRGVSAARNYGIQHTSGEYIVFVDSDDFIDETFCEKLYAPIKYADLSICGVTEQFFPVTDICLDTRLFFSLPAEFNYLQYTNFSVNKLYKRSIINKYNICFPEDIELGEDALFLSDYFAHIQHVACLSNPLYHYVPNATSATKQFQPEYWNWEQQIIHKQWESFNQYPLTEREKSYNYAWLFHKFNGVMNHYHKLGKFSHKEIISKVANDKLFCQLLKSSIVKEEFWSKEMLHTLNSWRSAHS